MGKATKLIGIGLVGAMIVAPGGIAAGKKKKPRKVTRTETYEYTGSGGTRTAAITGSICLADQTCRVLMTLPKEKFVKIEISDASGQPAPFFVHINKENHPFCGSMDSPLALEGATQIDVTVGAVWLPECAGVGTSGSFTATFSNRP